MSLTRYYHTLKYLRPVQLKYQLLLRLKNRHKSIPEYHLVKKSGKKGCLLNFSEWIDKQALLSENNFNFLNITKEYPNRNINWNEKQHGLLWAYNLNYMDYLLQKDLSKEEGIAFISNFIEDISENITGIDPYPISLRGINWVKFLSWHKISDLTIDQSLNQQFNHLYKNPEYHLLGNHLLENGFSLLFGAFYFNEKKFYKKAYKILVYQLKEQILDDGGHFELSPMYHQIILERVLDSINLLKNNNVFSNQGELLNLLENKAGYMISWLKNMTFSNGEMPSFNDSAVNIATSTKDLLKYASNLKLVENLDIKLSKSGYRRFNGSKYECIVDVGKPGPEYQPGHSHADMLSFVLYVNGYPVIIDKGISTYEKNSVRQAERSTDSHNTVTINDTNQSDVWGGFRLGKRAKLSLIVDMKNLIIAEHNGYYPVIHKRIFKFKKNKLTIFDELSKKCSGVKSYLHFNSGCSVEQKDGKIVINKSLQIEIRNAESIELVSYKQPLGFNKYTDAKKAIIIFKKDIETNIKVN